MQTLRCQQAFKWGARVGGRYNSLLSLSLPTPSHSHCLTTTATMDFYHSPSETTTQDPRQVTPLQPAVGPSEWDPSRRDCQDGDAYINPEDWLTAVPSFAHMFHSAFPPDQQTNYTGSPGDIAETSNPADRNPSARSNPHARAHQASAAQQSAQKQSKDPAKRRELNSRKADHMDELREAMCLPYGTPFLEILSAAIERLGGVVPQADAGARVKAIRFAYQELHRLSGMHGRLEHVRCLQWALKAVKGENTLVFIHQGQPSGSSD
ncbi:hypothetical protein BJ322DRAFT_527348 [Thelephora terrestris]|uniref:Uncharacterized protein n=1 Tax=Thelephora terrestris TaxID=56493 RepID=A0A9P6HKT8_9AGAM|nr:hypothetical protein BJ322DRAFT_527348 [Thelephora terrestris]